ncbi:MAG: hypothetical protein IJH32_09835 [Ruminococcus sp.]|nr:hypothetical protein [Ruminococcus sp.]
MKEVKMRRYQNLLTVSGLGVIAFGLWSVLKTFLLLILRNDMREQMFEKMPNELLVKVIVYVILAFLVLTDFGIRLFVGLSARAEGFGKKKGYAYIVFAILIALSSLGSLLLLIFGSNPDESLLELTVSTIVEVTNLVVMIELLVAAFTVKKLKKEISEV